MMYYYLPKAANRPIYSYRLSIVHFWALIFIYIWAGPHHLLYTALPDWAQSLGTVFSIMLLAPSWGGMLNGLLTLRGAWEKLRESAVLKFLVVAVTAYGMATFEGPLLAIKSVNALSHYTDWTVAHVHVGVLGWNGFLTFGILYWLIPRLYKTELFSSKLANFHFWIGFLGILVYALPVYIAGIAQGLMWKEFTPEGFLRYPNFLETVIQIIPMYIIRAIGGSIYFVGILAMGYNLVKTIRKGSLERNEKAEAAALPKDFTAEGDDRKRHRWLERRPVQFLLLATIAVAIGGAIEMIPTFLIKSNIPTISSVKPYSPLELQGRDIYVREGCYNCHSQMIRPFRSETERYGEYSKAGEFVYDHPFQWGSKRTGPDLHRIGRKYPDAWHYNHMLEPEAMSPGSIMPPYPWLITDQLDNSSLENKIRVMRTLGVPYPKGYDTVAINDLTVQAEEIAGKLQDARIDVEWDREIIAMIAYLQRLGTDIKMETGN
jgi:cytochrome c oxidase cbb3-type subunit I/II